MSWVFILTCSRDMGNVHKNLVGKPEGEVPLVTRKSLRIWH